LQHLKFDYAVRPLCLLCLHTPCFSWIPTHVNLRRVRSGDRGGQFCGSPRPIHLSGNCLFRYCVTCRLKCGVLLEAGSASVILF
jgi:hypothetical protein